MGGVTNAIIIGSLPPTEERLNDYFEYYLYALAAVFGVFFIYIVLPAIPRTLPFGHRIPKRKWNLPWLLQKFADARKHVLYSVTDVHDYNGQSRLMTVSLQDMMQLNTCTTTCTSCIAYRFDKRSIADVTCSSQSPVLLLVRVATHI